MKGRFTMNFINTLSLVHKIYGLRENRLNSLKKIRGSQSIIVKWMFAALILCLLLGVNVPHVIGGEVIRQEFVIMTPPATCLLPMRK
jgi:hypothetical protein